MSRPGQLECDCGCGEYDYMNRLQKIEIGVAIDESLRRTAVAKRFFVRTQCYDAFLEELHAMKLLNDAVRRYTQARFFVRLVKMRQIIRLQWLVNERLKGEKRARRLSIRSGLMFASGPRVAGWLDNFWRWKDRTFSKFSRTPTK